MSFATTHKEGFVVDISVLEGNPHDGHTLKKAIERTIQNTNVKVKEATVDRGYVGHGVTDVIVNISTDKKDIPENFGKLLIAEHSWKQ